MSLLDLFDDREKLSAFRAIDSVLLILSDDLFVCGYLDDVEVVYLLELFFFGLGGTCHARELSVQPEEVLEGYGGESLGLALDLYAFFGFDRLMQTLVIASAVHQTAGELIYDDYLAVLDDVVDLVLHAAVGLDSLVYMVLYGDVVGI